MLTLSAKRGGKQQKEREHKEKMDSNITELCTFMFNMISHVVHCIIPSTLP